MSELVPESVGPRNYVVRFAGPYSWEGAGEDALFASVEGKSSGLYLLTAHSDGGYFIYSAGITTRSFANRLWEHTKEYLSGNYNVLDAKALRQGTRVVLWEGFWDARDAWQRLTDHRARWTQLVMRAHELLETFQIFVAPLSAERRVLERIEAAIMTSLYDGSGKVAALPDREMRLLPRRQEEEPIIVRVESDVRFHGLPAAFEA
jgi:hypothetical protein